MEKNFFKSFKSLKRGLRVALKQNFFSKSNSKEIKKLLKKFSADKNWPEKISDIIGEVLSCQRVYGTESFSASISDKHPGDPTGTKTLFIEKKGDIFQITIYKNLIIFPGVYHKNGVETHYA